MKANKLSYALWILLLTLLFAPQAFYLAPIPLILTLILSPLDKKWRESQERKRKEKERKKKEEFLRWYRSNPEHEL